MADSTIDHNLFYLLDQWPGNPWQVGDVPTGGFTGTSHHNVTTAAYPVGTKMHVMCTHTSYTLGGATFIYLRNIAIESTSFPVQAKHFVANVDTNQWYNVSNDHDNFVVDMSCPAAVGLSTMSTTTGAYGWFWCGGVAPIQYVAALDGVFATDSSVTAGPAIITDLVSTTTTYGTIGLGLRVITTGMLPVAMCLKTDT